MIPSEVAESDRDLLQSYQEEGSNYSSQPTVDDYIKHHFNKSIATTPLPLDTIKEEPYKIETGGDVKKIDSFDLKFPIDKSLLG